jgi:DNA repair photolyase
MEEWGTFVHVKRNLPAVLAREVRSLPRGLVAISTATDPYQYLEAKYLATRHCLEVLARADWPVTILTRSPLVIRDIDLFRRFGSIRVGMSVPTIDDEARKVLEPYAPSIPSRLKTLRRLSEMGFRTFISFAPAYPPTKGMAAEDIAKVLASTGVRRIRFRPLDLRPGARTAMVRRIAGSPLEADLGRIVDMGYMVPFLRELEEALGRRGVSFGPYWRERKLLGSGLGSPSRHPGG